jgi:uncharacterized protein (DUF1501 family)
MITIQGGRYRLCSGITRRDALRIGTLGIAGFTLADLLQLKAEASPTPGKAKSIIMIHLGGGPSQTDTYDPKPDAPMEIRGEFKPIATKVDGIRIGELFPLQAAMMDRLAIVRTIARGVDEHSSSHTVTGYSNGERRAQGDRPSIGSVLARVKGKPESILPPYVSLRGYNAEQGLGAAYLGATYEPLVSDGPGRDDLKLRVNTNRLSSRRKLLEMVDSFRKVTDTAAVTARDSFSQRAMEIVGSTATYDALNVGKETEETRKRYGNDQFVLARRLVEAGVQCVALEVGGWDTHSDNFNQLRRIMPPLDKALTCLLNDLKDRGLDQDTLVVMWGEFGRTPRVNGAAGRDHWSPVMSALVAGGGLKMGQVVGTTDSQAAYPESDAQSIRGMVATLYHALGIDPHTTFIDQQNRPIPLIHDAEPIAQLIG